MIQYTVTGMSCAACSARVEKAVAAVEGVDSVSVSLLTNSMGVEGRADTAAVIKAVEDAGYGAALKGTKENSATTSDQEDALKDRETPVLKKRLIWSLVFLCPLMYVSMGHMMWGWPLPQGLADDHMAMGMLEMLFTIIIMVINQKFFISGFKGLMHKSPNMDTLVALGSGAAFGYSIYALFAMADGYARMDMDAVMKFMDEFYFESAAMILTLITVGKMLEARSKGKTTDALKGLMKLAPKTATLLVDGKEEEVSVDRVNIGDIFVVHPGESIPVDGIVIDGISSVNEAALTGESIPADKEKGDPVSAATTNISGYITCRATKVGQDTTLSKIIQMVSDAAATKAPIARIADKISGIFVPVVISIAIITFIIWMLCGQTVGYSIARAISVLVISCPCALGLATPVAIMVGNGVGARNGILFKTSASLEQTGAVDMVVLDKTGTITKGEPKTTDVIPADGITEEELLQLAVTLEQFSEHPLAKAVVDYCDQKNVAHGELENFTALTGSGVRGIYKGREAYAGSGKFIRTIIAVPKAMEEYESRFADSGKTPLFFACDQKLFGMIAVADVIKEDSAEAVKQLQNMGIRVIMLTGDNEKTAAAIGRQAGADKVIAGVLPDEKADVVRRLKELGRVAMVGDGINDAPALTMADTGIAIGAGTDIAIDAADIVLMKSGLIDVPAAIRLSRATLTNIHENLFWAFFYNVIGIPLAAGAYVGLFGWSMNPMFGAAAMSLSSFCVVSNALRLNLFKLYKPNKKTKKEVVGIEEIAAVLSDISAKAEKCNKELCGGENAMEKTMNIKGMMCCNCEKHVKKALEALDGVDEAVVSHEAGTAIVKCSAAVTDDALKEAVTEEGYEVVGIN